LAQDGGAGRAENDSLGMAEDSGNVEAAWNGVFYRLVTVYSNFFSYSLGVETYQGT